jgi:hypothetical protein
MINDATRSSSTSVGRWVEVITATAISDATVTEAARTEPTRRRLRPCHRLHSSTDSTTGLAHSGHDAAGVSAVRS